MVLRRALTAYAAGDFATAQKLFRRILAKKPDAPGIRHNLALTCIAVGQYDEAEPLLLNELENYGEYYPRVKVLADLYYISGNRSKAHDFYKRSRELDPPEHDVALLDKRIALTSDDNVYEQVTAAHRSFEDGNELMAEERWDQAISHFRHAADLDPTNIHALNNAGTIYLNNRDEPAEAVKLFRQALAWSPLPWIKRNLAQAEGLLEHQRAETESAQKPTRRRKV